MNKLQILLEGKNLNWQLLCGSFICIRRYVI